MCKHSGAMGTNNDAETTTTMALMRKLRFMLRSSKRIVDDSALYAQLVITRDCNLSCAYCNEYATGMPPVPAQTLRKRIDQLNELGVLVYDLLGGEPLLHPELPSLVRHIKSKRGGANLAVLITNGFFVDNKVGAISQRGRFGYDATQRRFCAPRR
ncbi:MAG: radical SAM protein [Mariprofundaceae bacterium]